MQAHYPAAFEREMGCTAAELRAWLPAASAGHAIEWRDDGAVIEIGAGRATLRWQVLPARRIALISLPRLRLIFETEGVADDAWQRFMRRFDLYTQRGGG
jgi:hypothetical protein